MSETRILRSVKTLEEEIAALERAALGEAEAEPEEEVEQEVEVEEAQPEPKPVDPEDESFKKRYADLRRHSQKQADQLRELEDKIKTLEKTKSVAGLPSAEEAEQWVKENPKAAAIIFALADKTTLAQKEDLATIKDKLHRSEQEAAIRKAHPDFEDIVDTDAFHDWADKQPQSVQKLIFSTSADDVIWAVSQYKSLVLTKPVDPKKEAAKAVSTKTSSADPKTESKGRFTESAVRAMSLSEYEKNEAAIMQAQRDGTFVYDLSGAAR